MTRLALALAALCCGCAPVDSAADDDDVVDDDDAAWDPAPPDLEEGATFTGLLTCGLFAEPVERRWTLGPTGWEETTEASARPVAEVVPCLQDGPKTFDWHPDGSIVFEAAGWRHALRSTATENLWTGEGTPNDAPSADCLDGLDAVGLELPVIFSLSLLELTP